MRRAALCLAMAWILPGSIAWADAPKPSVALAHEPEPAYRLTWQIDIPVLLIAGTIGSGWLLKGSLAGPHCAPLCDRYDVPPFDRWAAGRWDRGWKTVSDIGLASVVAGSLVAVVAAEGPKYGLYDWLVVLQSVVVANAFAVISETSVRRPRPFVYGTDAPLEARMDGNASLSFFSGHTTASMTAAVATFVTFRRLNYPLLSWVTLGVGVSGAAFVGVTRVLAGDHFPTDVLAGATVGAATGVLVPVLHERPVVVTPTAQGRGLQITGIF